VGLNFDLGNISTFII